MTAVRSRFAGILLLILAAGCASLHNHDPRLEGTWRNDLLSRTVTFSNGTAYITVIGESNLVFYTQHNSVVTNIVADAHGNLVVFTNRVPNAHDNERLVIYSNGVPEKVSFSYPYRIFGFGSDYVDVRYPEQPLRNEFSSYVDERGEVVRVIAAVPSDQRIHFTPDNNAFWIGKSLEKATWYKRATSEPPASADGTPK